MINWIEKKPIKILSTILSAALLTSSIQATPLTNLLNTNTRLVSHNPYSGKKNPEKTNRITLVSGDSLSKFSDYVVFATHSVWLKQNSCILSGNVGINDVGSSPFLDSQVELSIGNNVTTLSDVDIKANRIKIKHNAVIGGNVYYNELSNNGIINGSLYTPLNLPLIDSLPSFYNSVPGNNDIMLKNNEEFILEPGNYGNIRLKQNCRLIFTGGIYNIRSINTGNKADLLFRNPCEIRILEKFDTDQNSYIGPEDTTSVSSSDIMFYIAGINGKNGNLKSSPKAAEIGIKNTVLACFYVPNGTLWIRHNSNVKGKFIAKDIIVGINVHVSISQPSAPVNQPPEVNAGPDKTADFSNPITLNGSVTDDGLPEGNQLIVRWKQISGPGIAVFSDTTQPITSVRFGVPGSYVLRLTASDGELTSSDDVVVTVNPPPENKPPTVNAGPDQCVGLTYGATLHGIVNDDGLPYDRFLTTIWEKVSGPGYVGFRDPHNPITDVTFSQTGTYTLRLTADDGGLKSFDDVVVTIYTDNLPPIVNAGEDQTVTTAEGFLKGSVMDDGLPAGKELSLQWSKTRGPGSVVFQNQNSAFTTVSFSEAGRYVLCLSADDGMLSASDTLTIIVQNNRPPIVNAGSDTTIETVVPFSTDTITPPPQPVAQPDWLYDIGRPGVNKAVSLHGIDVEDHNVYIGGEFNQAGGAETGSIAKWNTCTWSSFYDPRPSDPEDPTSQPVGLVYSYYGGNVMPGVQGEKVFITGGLFSDLNRPPDGFLDYFAYWSGTGWEAPFFRLTFNFINFNDICVGRDGIYIGGYFRFQPIDPIPGEPWPHQPIPGYPEAYNIAKWNGTNWEVLGSGITDINDSREWGPGGSVVAIASGPNGFIFAAGMFQMETPYGTAENIAWWDGNEWRPMGSGISGGSSIYNPSGDGSPWPVVNDLQVDSIGNLYAGGNFTIAGGVSVRNIAKATWDETTQTWTWSSLGEGGENGLDMKVNAIALKDTSVYVGGCFSHAGSVSANYIARWDGISWHSIESSNGVNGVNSYVTALAANKDGVYIGGLFTQAGGEPASHIVGWGAVQKKYVEGLDSVLIKNAPQTGAEAVITTRVNQRCGDALTLTWNVDGGPPEKTQTLQAGTTADTQQVSFTYLYTPGTHLVTLIADDGYCVPIVRNTTVTVLAPARAVLRGTVTDDGLPSGILNVTWMKLKGPGNVVFDNPNQAQTTATFEEPGTYLLRLTADDTQYTKFDEVTICIKPADSENLPPVVSAGNDKNIYLSEPLNLYGSATDDGLPSGILTHIWTKVSGPGVVTFDDPYSLKTKAHFSESGIYQLRLTADDSEFSTSDDIMVFVSFVQNQAPIVFAGNDQTIPLSGHAVLNDSVSDDGLLYGILNYEWTKITGPSRPFFHILNDTTYITFSEPGTYLLSLSATDGSFTSTDSVTITVTDEVLPSLTEIDLPMKGDAITSPIKIIGSVRIPDMTGWELSYRLEAENENWTMIASGNEPILNSVLGVFDPSLLKNGLYKIRLRSTDITGQNFTDQIDVIVKGGLKVGNFTVSFIDLDIPVSGIPIQIVRTYDSRDKKSHDFGTGWTFDVRDIRIQETGAAGDGWLGVIRGTFVPMYCIEPSRPHIVTVTASDGSVHEFDVAVSPQMQAAPPSTVTLSFVPRPGTTSSLTTLEPMNLLVNGTFRKEGGSISLLNQTDAQIFDPDKYVLTLKDGRKLKIDQIEGLEELRDRNANTLQITDNGIIHSSGKSVTFTRDSRGRIIRITDPMGNTINYQYDTNGDLISVTDQRNYTTTFTYDANHYLTDIIDPRGITPARQLYDDDGRMIAMIDAEGDTIHLNHDINARQEIVKDRLGNITVYEYDDQGNVVNKTDAKGNSWFYTYDEFGNKLSETDPDGNTRSYTYDEKGNMLTETDPLGCKTIYTYNENGQILTKTDPMGNVWTYTYDENGNKISETDPTGYTKTFSYDGSGNLISESDTLGTSISKEYDEYGNVTKETDALGHETFYTYDANGNQITQTRTRTTPSGPVTMIWEKTYDEKGNVISITDPDGNTSYTEYNELGKKSAEIDKLGRRTEYVYDHRGNQIKKIYPDGTEETFTFDANGNRTSSTDREGRTTYYEYDQNVDRISKITFPTAGFIGIETDATGSYTAITDDRGNRTTYKYDLSGNLIKIINALGDSTTYTYDASGNQISMTDARGNTTRYEYDARGNKTKIIYPDGTFVLMAYDVRGNKIVEQDQAGNVTFYDYDLLDRLVKVTDALGHETSYTYDEVGNKLTQTDANGHVTKWEYDNLGRVIKHILPLGQEETFTYDAVGNVRTHTDFNGNTTTFEYDNSNRVIKKIFHDSSEEKFSYTATGRQDTVIDARGTTLNFYDSGDRLVKVVNPDSSIIEYQYDSMGNRTAVIVGDDTTRYTFDQLNHLKTVTDPDGGVTTYTYDPNGNRKSIIYPNGTIAEYTYDSLNRLTKLLNKKSNGDTISCYVYTLGPAGNRVKVTEHTGRTVQYTYDATYKLVEEKIDDPDFGIRTISYTYDPVGNRLTKTDDGVVTNYTYDENDRLLTENDITYTYDNNGNTILKVEGTDSTRYEYDFENRLIKVNNGSDVIEYSYDTDGMRVQKTVNGNITKFLLDKNRDYAQVLKEYDDSGQTIVDYTYGNDLISQKRGSLKSYYHYDGQMSTRQLTDSNSLVTDTYTYDAFGLLLNRSGATENNYMYTGEQYDPNVGFYYLRARYYNQSNGRFLTMDTWAGSMFEPASLHKYLYCAGNPVGNWDPSGELTYKTVVEVAASIGIRLILASVVYTSATHLLSWLLGKKEPIEWTGNMVIGTFSPPSLKKGWGLILAGLTGRREGEPPVSESYVILMAGFSVSKYPINVSVPITGVSLKTPGLFGLNTWTLLGPASWISGSRTEGYDGFGAGVTFSNFNMGMGWGFSPLDLIIGRDTGIDAMGGLSFYSPRSF